MIILDTSKIISTKKARAKSIDIGLFNFFKGLEFNLSSSLFSTFSTIIFSIKAIKQPSSIGLSTVSILSNTEYISLIFNTTRAVRPKTRLINTILPLKFMLFICPPLAPISYVKGHICKSLFKLYNLNTILIRFYIIKKYNTSSKIYKLPPYIVIS